MNIPNSLSIFRILLVPVFVSVFFSGSKHAPLFAVLIFLFAGFTDILDGYIARKKNLITGLGRILDPLADKLMILSALSCLSFAKLLPWWITIVYLLKEMTQVLLGAIFFKKQRDVPSSNRIGKTATISFYISIVVLILFEGVPYTLKLGLFFLSLLLALAAFATYYLNAVKTAAGNYKEP